MKTVIDLPESLVWELQQRAQQAGQDLAQAAAELLWKGLAATPSANRTMPHATVKRHAITGLPYIECSQSASPAAEMTPDRVAAVLLEQEAEWHDEAGR